MYLPRFRKKCCFQKHVAFLLEGHVRDVWHSGSEDCRALRFHPHCLQLWCSIRSARKQSKTWKQHKGTDIKSESFLFAKRNHKENIRKHCLCNWYQMIIHLTKDCNSFDASLEGRKTSPMFEAIWHTGQTRTREIYDQAIENLPQDGWCFMIVVEWTQPCWLRVQADCIWFDTTRASSFSETYMSTWILPE